MGEGTIEIVSSSEKVIGDCWREFALTKHVAATWHEYQCRMGRSLSALHRWNLHHLYILVAVWHESLCMRKAIGRGEAASVYFA